MLEALGPEPTGKRVGVWGLTFKAGTDDLRQSPSLEVIKRLITAGVEVHGYDPAVKGPVPEVPELNVSADPYAAVKEAEVLVVLTEWDEFRWLDFDQVAAQMQGRAVIDARNILDSHALRRRGFSYRGTGR